MIIIIKIINKGELKMEIKSTISFTGRQRTYLTLKSKEIHPQIETSLEDDRQFFKQLMDVKGDDIKSASLWGGKKKNLIDRIFNRPEKINLDIKFKDNIGGRLSTAFNMILLETWKLPDNTIGQWSWYKNIEKHSDKKPGQKLLNQTRKHLIEIAREFKARKV